MEQSELLKILVGVIAVLVLFLRGLLDFLKGRKEKAPSLTADQVKAAVVEALKEAAPITREQAKVLLITTARKQQEELLGKVPCYGRPPGEDCASRVRDALEGDLQHVSDMVAQVLTKLAARSKRHT